MSSDERHYERPWMDRFLDRANARAVFDGCMAVVVEEADAREALQRKLNRIRELVAYSRKSACPHTCGTSDQCVSCDVLAILDEEPS